MFKIGSNTLPGPSLFFCVIGVRVSAWQSFVSGRLSESYASHVNQSIHYVELIVE